MTQNLTISEDELESKLQDGIGLDPTLSDEALEKMKYNRKTEFYHPDMRYLDGEPLADSAYTAHRAVLNAKSQLERLQIPTSTSEEEPADVEERIAQLTEIIQEGARRHFELLSPLLQYHEYWEDAGFASSRARGFETLDPDGGLSQLADVDFQDLTTIEAVAVEQEMATAEHAFGLYVDISGEIRETQENVDYWMGELTDETR